MQCSSAVLTMNWQEQKRFFFFASNVLKFANSKWEHNGWTLQIWSKNMRPYFIPNTAFPQIILAAIFLLWRCQKFHIHSLCKVQRAEDTCHLMSKTLHLCWEHLNFRAVFEAAEELLRKVKKKLKLTALASQQGSLVLNQ